MYNKFTFKHYVFYDCRMISINTNAAFIHIGVAHIHDPANIVKIHSGINDIVNDVE